MLNYVIASGYTWILSCPLKRRLETKFILNQGDIISGHLVTSGLSKLTENNTIWEAIGIYTLDDPK